VVGFYSLGVRVFSTPCPKKSSMNEGCVRGYFKYIHSRRDHFDPFIASIRGHPSEDGPLLTTCLLLHELLQTRQMDSDGPAYARRPYLSTRHEAPKRRMAQSAVPLRAGVVYPHGFNMIVVQRASSSRHLQTFADVRL
jgi:hypothetical protein